MACSSGAMVAPLVGQQQQIEVIVRIDLTCR